jgi:hypothetical protein
MQLVTHQRELHKQAVSVIETLYAGELGPHFGVLAYHAEQANLVDQAQNYHEVKGSDPCLPECSGIDYFRASDHTCNRHRYANVLNERSDSMAGLRPCPPITISRA